MLPAQARHASAVLGRLAMVGFQQSAQMLDANDLTLAALMLRLDDLVDALVNPLVPVKRRSDRLVAAEFARNRSISKRTAIAVTGPCHCESLGRFAAGVGKKMVHDTPVVSKASRLRIAGKMSATPIAAPPTAREFL